MNMFRKGILVLFALLIALGLLAGGAMAATKSKPGSVSALNVAGPEVSASSDIKGVRLGGSFTVTFSVYNVQDLYGASLDLKFDKNLLEVQSAADVQPGDVFSGLQYLTPFQLIAYHYNNDGTVVTDVYGYPVPHDAELNPTTVDDVNAAGLINYLVTLSGPVPGINVNDKQSLVFITFKVKENAPLDADLTKAIQFNITPGKNPDGTSIIPLPDQNVVVNLANSNLGYPASIISFTPRNTALMVVGVPLWGYVFDAHADAPVAGAMVFYSDQTGGGATTTNADGLYTFNVPSGTYQITVSAGGYAIPVENGVVVDAAETKQVNIGLFPPLPSGAYRAVLKYFDYNSQEMDAHLTMPVAPGAGQERVYWGNEGNDDLSQYPNAVWYGDWMGDFNWFLEDIAFNPVAAGKYSFLVNDWYETNFAGPKPVVQLYDSAGLVQEFSVPQTVYGNWWHVFSIEKEQGGAVGPVIALNTVDNYDGSPASVDFVGTVPGEGQIQETAHDTVEGTVYYSSFDVLVDAYNVDWSTFNKDTDVEVWLQGKGPAGRINASSVADAVYNADDSRRIVVHFDEVPAGEYHLGIRVKDAFDHIDVYVDTYAHLPVAQELQPGAVPAGEKYFGFGIGGYNLQPLNTGTVIELVYGTEVVATTQGDASEEWLGVTGSPEGSNLWVEMKAIGTEIAVGSYKVAIGNSSPNWDPAVGNRLPSMLVTDLPYLTGEIYPWVLGAGQNNYKLAVKGFNMENLSAADLGVSLSTPGGFWQADASSVSVAVYGQENGEGFIKAEFTQPLPNFETGLELGIVYTANNTPVPGSEHLGVKVTAEPVVYGVLPHSDIAQKTEYDLTLKGWNLDQDAEYRVRLISPNGMILSVVNSVYAANSTDLPVSFQLAGPLPGGGYRIDVFEQFFDVEYPIGQAWFDVKQPQSLVHIQEDSLAGLQETFENGSYATPVDVIINVQNMVPADYLEVWLDNRGERIDAYSISSPDLSGNVTAHFTALQAGRYVVTAKLNDQWDKREFAVDSFEHKPVIYRVSPTRAPTGAKFYGFNIEGYNLDLLAGAEITFNEGGTAANPAGTVVASTYGPEEWLGVKVNDDGTSARVDIKAVPDTGLPAGQYSIKVNSPSWDPAVGDRFYVSMWVVDDPFLTGFVYPNLLGAGVTEYTVEVQGFNLHRLAGALDVQLMDINNPAWTAQALTVTTAVYNQETGEGVIRAAFNNQLPDHKTQLSMYISGAPIQIEDSIYLKVTDNPVVYGVEPRGVEPGLILYNLTLKGWNLTPGSGYEVELYGPNNFYMQRSVSAPNSTDLPFDIADTPLQDGGYRFQVYQGDQWIGDAWLKVNQPHSSIHIVGPAEGQIVVQETQDPLDGSYYASFNVVIETAGIDWSTVQDSDIEVGLDGGPGRILAQVTGPDDGNRLTASFSHINPGFYKITAKVQGLFDAKGLQVQSWNSLPVITTIWSVAVPAGTDHPWFQMQGVNLQSLGTDLVVELQRPGDNFIVASTEGTDPWLGAKISSDGRWMHVDMKTTSGGIAVGDYNVVVRGSGWNPSVGARYGQLSVTDQPFLVYVNPKVLGVGINDYFLEFEGFNLGSLSPVGLHVELRNMNDQSLVADATVVTLTYSEPSFNPGTIKADFNTPLPAHSIPLMASVKKSDGSYVLGGEGVPIMMTDKPVVYGVNPKGEQANKPSYGVTLLGWNLVQGQSYGIELLGPDNSLVLDTAAIASSATGIPVAVPHALSAGTYNWQVFDGTDSIGTIHWDIKQSQSWGSINIVLPASPPVEAQQPDGYYTSFNITVQTNNVDWSSVQPADIEVLLDGNGQKILAQVTRPEGSNTLTAAFNRVSAGKYQVVARVKDRFDFKQMQVQSYNNLPVILAIRTVAIPAGSPYAWFDMEGMNLDLLGSGTVVELKDDAGNIVASTNGVDFGPVSIFNEGTWMHVNLKASGTGIPAGNYNVVITNPAWNAAAGARYGQVWVTDQPFLTNVNPRILGVGVNSYTLEFEGYNLGSLNPANLSVELRDMRDGTLNLIASATNITVEASESSFKPGKVIASFDTALPSQMIPLMASVRLTAGGYVPGGEGIPIMMADFPVVYGVSPAADQTGKTSYNVTLKGWNLVQGKSYVIKLSGPNSGDVILYTSADAVSPTEIPVIVTTGLNQGGYTWTVLEGNAMIGTVHWDIWQQQAPPPSPGLEVKPGRLSVDYPAQTIILKDLSQGGTLWSTGEQLGIRVMKENKSGPPTEPVSVQITGILVQEDYLTFTIGSGLPQGKYVIQVIRGEQVIAHGPFGVLPPSFSVSPNMVSSFPATLSFLPPGNMPPAPNSFYVVVKQDTPGATNPVFTGWATPAGLNYNVTLSGPLAPGQYNILTFWEQPVEGQFIQPFAIGFFGVDGGAMTIDNSPLPAGTQGQTYSYSFNVTGGVPPYQWSLEENSFLPQGLYLSSGVIAGTPTASGTFNFTVVVDDNANHRTSRNVTLIINPAAAPVINTGSSLPAATEGQNYNVMLTATGGLPGYTWSTGSVLPAGIELSPSGVIWGTPSATGNFSFTATVTDMNNNETSKTFTLIVNPAGGANLAISTNATLPSATEGQSYSLILSATGGSSPYSWELASTSVLPTGLNVSGSGILSGTPTVSGSFTFTIGVKDSANQTAVKSFTLTINPASQAGTITSISIAGSSSITIPVTGIMLQTYTASVKNQIGQTMDYETVTWSLEAPVNGVSVESSSGKVTVDTTAAAGTFTLKATSNSQPSVLQTKIVSLIAATPGAIIPNLVFDRSGYAAGSTVHLSLKLTGVQTGDKTNSVTFDIEYDSNTFELATGNASDDVTNGYIQFTTKNDMAVSDTVRKISAMLTAMSDTELVEGGTVLTVNFKVKPDATLGTKTFTLKPVDMLDTSFKSYNINNNLPVTVQTSIADYAIVEAYVSLYLGDTGTGLNNLILNNLDQNAINETIKNLKITIKRDAEDPGTEISGQDAAVQDGSGNYGARENGGNRVIARFLINVTDTSSTIIRIEGAGYLAKETNVTISAGQTTSISTAENPLVIYPGDLGQVISGQGLVLTPDQKVNNVDFSAWLKIYKDGLAGTASAADRVRADLTKNGKIDNVDFSLWLASYKKLLTLQ